MLLHEAEGHTIVVELKTGEIYRGLLEESEDTMNCRLKEGNITINNNNVNLILIIICLYIYSHCDAS